MKSRYGVERRWLCQIIRADDELPLMADRRAQFATCTGLLDPEVRCCLLGNGNLCSRFRQPMTLQALANDPRQDAEYKGLIGVNVDGSGARLVITVAH